MGDREARLQNACREFPEITNTWNPVTGCMHGCVYCWARRYAERLSKMGVKPYAEKGFRPAFIPERFRKRFSKNSFIFVSDMGDLFGDWVPREWINRVLSKIRESSQTYFLLLTKNPKRYLSISLPNNVVAGATIESNRNYPNLSKAPPQTERIEAMKKLHHVYKALVIEPILEFDIEEFTKIVKEISPSLVYIGYDNYRFNLPEPILEKTSEFIGNLSKFTDVRFGTIRKAFYEE